MARPPLPLLAPLLPLLALASLALLPPPPPSISAQADAGSAPAPVPVPVLDVEAFDDGASFRLRPSRDAVDPGPLRVRFWNNGTVGHDLASPGLGIDVPCCVAPGRMVEVAVEVPDRPGAHRLWCRPHEALGMEATLRVSGDHAAPGPAPLLAVLLAALLAACTRTRPPPATKPL